MLLSLLTSIGLAKEMWNNKSDVGATASSSTKMQLRIMSHCHRRQDVENMKGRGEETTSPFGLLCTIAQHATSLCWH